MLVARERVRPVINARSLVARKRERERRGAGRGEKKHTTTTAALCVYSATRAINALLFVRSRTFFDLATIIFILYTLMRGRYARFAASESAVLVRVYDNNNNL